MGEQFDPRKLPRAVSASIRSVTIEDTIIPVKDGRPLIRRRTKITLHDKIRALEALGPASWAIRPRPR